MCTSLLKNNNKKNARQGRAIEMNIFDDIMSSTCFLTNVALTNHQVIQDDPRDFSVI